MIVPLNLPQAKLKLRRKNNDVFVWCVLRKKELVCTPEEWVRQHLIHFLISSGFSQNRLASEVTVEYNGMKKRADLVYYNKNFEPIMIVECKAPDVQIDESVLHQAAKYNRNLQVEYLFLSNGIHHVIGKIDREKGDIEYLDEIPDDLA